MRHKKVLSVLLSVILMSGFSVANAMDSTQVFYKPIKQGEPYMLATGYTNPLIVGGASVFVTNVKSKCPVQTTTPRLQLAAVSGDTGGGTVDAIFLNGYLDTSTYNIVFTNTRVQRFVDYPRWYPNSPLVVNWTIYCIPN
jgi:hypothetical protein